jgi:hypothetical protein
MYVLCKIYLSCTKQALSVILVVNQPLSSVLHCFVNTAPSSAAVKKCSSQFCSCVLISNFLVGTIVASLHTFDMSSSSVQLWTLRSEHVSCMQLYRKLVLTKLCCQMSGGCNVLAKLCHHISGGCNVLTKLCHQVSSRCNVLAKQVGCNELTKLCH